MRLCDLTVAKSDRFQADHRRFPICLPAVAAELAILPNDAMTRDQVSNGIAADCRSDRPTGSRLSDGFCNVFVGTQTTGWNPQKCFPNLQLERRRFQIQLDLLIRNRKIREKTLKQMSMRAFGFA